MMMKKPFIALCAMASLSIGGFHAQAQGIEPAYTIVGNDSTCQIFVYSPAPDQGLRLAYLTEHGAWQEVGQLCSSDYGQWGAEKKMYAPFVTKAADGTWRAAWSVNDYSPCFAVAYSEDLVTWRPQDYPIVKEKGVLAPAIYQLDDGSFSIYLKTKQGKRYVSASEDFRTFKEDDFEAQAEDVLWTRDTATVAGKLLEGNAFQVPATHLRYIQDWFHAMAQLNAKTQEQLPKTAAELKNLTGKDYPETIKATLTVDEGKAKRISDRLMGIFFEDISRAADGGLYAEMVQNGDFEYNNDKPGENWNAKTAWTNAVINTHFDVLDLASIKPLSQNNPHFALLSNQEMVNAGWDGFAVIPAPLAEGLTLKKGSKFDFSLYACVPGGKKQLSVELRAKGGIVLARAKLKLEGNEWKQYKVELQINPKALQEGITSKDVTLALVPKGNNVAAIDMVSLFPRETYKGHGLRKDLAETIAALKPKFVRFPGGCMLHGDGLGNIYNWKESIGPLKDRKPARNIWNYHQTRGLGFYEYFQWCEDMGAQPLPVLAAGVPCQNSAANADGLGGQQGGIPMADMPAYIQDVLDLIEWANGDPATSKWAKMRADAGHPAPFNLSMIGIGNEDLVSTTFTERYLMISKAVKERYPNIEVIGTVGPFHWPSSDYIEGWKIANQNKGVFSMVDEHYYEQPGWFINNQDYYDHYDRQAPKVYLGEYASHGKDSKDNALAEGIHMCQLERNGDVVEMASYAPLLSKDGYSNWAPDMIYFTNDSIRLSDSYHMQRLFSTHHGDTYLPSTTDLPQELKKYVGISVVKDSQQGTTWLKIVNALPIGLNLQVKGKTYSVAARDAEAFAL